MKGSDKLALVVTTLSSFAGGLALGMLLAPKSGRETREWIAKNVEEVVHLSEEQLSQLAKRIRQSLDENLPDLYKATEDMDFKKKSESDSEN